MKDKQQILDILAKLPGASVGSITDKLNTGTVALDMADDVMGIAKPQRILEIGTHKGGSGTIWLGRSYADLTTFDIGGDWVNEAEHDQVVKVWNDEFAGRVTFFRADSTAAPTYGRLKDAKYDLGFVDGNHQYPYAVCDILLCLNLGIPYLLLDDYTSCEDVRRAAADMKLIHVKTYPAIHNVADIGCALFKAP